MNITYRGHVYTVNTDADLRGLLIWLAIKQVA